MELKPWWKMLYTGWRISLVEFAKELFCAYFQLQWGVKDSNEAEVLAIKRALGLFKDSKWIGNKKLIH